MLKMNLLYLLLCLSFIYSVKASDEIYETSLIKQSVVLTITNNCVAYNQFMNEDEFNGLTQYANSNMTVESEETIRNMSPNLVNPYMYIGFVFSYYSNPKKEMYIEYFYLSIPPYQTTSEYHLSFHKPIHAFNLKHIIGKSLESADIWRTQKIKSITELKEKYELPINFNLNSPSLLGCRSNSIENINLNVENLIKGEFLYPDQENLKNMTLPRISLKVDTHSFINKLGLGFLLRKILE